MAAIVLRWAAGAIFGLLVIAAVFSFAVGIAFDNEIWHGRARRLWEWIRLVGLAWFNIEVWGRVLYAITHWIA